MTVARLDAGSELTGSNGLPDVIGRSRGGWYCWSLVPIWALHRRKAAPSPFHPSCALGASVCYAMVGGSSDNRPLTKGWRDE